MPRLTSSQIADKMASRASAAQGDYTAGVMAVSTAPGQRAAANAAGYIQGVQDNQDKWKRKVSAVSLNDWQTATVAKASRFSSGVTAAKPKIVAFWDKFGPKLDAVTAQVKAMPNTNREQRIARAVAQMTGVSDAMKNG